MIKYARYQSPIGELTIVKSDLGLCYLTLPDLDEGRQVFMKKYFPDYVLQHDQKDCREIISQLKEYFQNKRTKFTIPLDLRTTQFYKQALERVTQVPFGQTVTYGQIARDLGKPTAVRAVGGANARNPIPIIIPCHRILASDGTLNGYAGGLAMKAFLLRHEGVKLDD